MLFYSFVISDGGEVDFDYQGPPNTTNGTVAEDEGAEISLIEMSQYVEVAGSLLAGSLSIEAALAVSKFSKLITAE